jgi:hypothetical protein
MVKPENASAQIPKPSAPEFTLKVVEHPYYAQTGKQVENNSIEFIIKNQPFTPFLAADSHRQINLYYNISYKEHYEEHWSYSYDYFSASNSNYTIITIGLSTIPDRGTIGNISGEADFRVQALTGYYSSQEFLQDTYLYSFFGETSDWSSTQTITIPISSNSPTATPTTSIQGWVTQLTFSIIAVAILAIVIISVLLYRRHRKTAKPNQ